MLVIAELTVAAQEICYVALARHDMHAQEALGVALHARQLRHHMADCLYY